MRSVGRRNGKGHESTPAGPDRRRRGQRPVDTLVAEEPLEIRLNGRPLAITMRTPGDDFDLAAGFLVSEGVVGRR